MFRKATAANKIVAPNIMFGATILLAAVAFLNMHLTQQAKAGSSPNPSVMRVIPPIARTSLALVLIGVAVLTTPF